MINKKTAYELRAGSIANLKTRAESLKDPEAHQVQVEIKAIGLNFADLFAIWGLYSATPKGAFTPGLEYSGIISKVGDEVEDFSAGDKIMGITRFGAYSTAINIDHRYVVALPPDWDFAEGAAFLVQAMTAYYALFILGDLREDSAVLIHSGAGGVGIFANRLAKSAGAYTVGTTGSHAKVEFMLKEGYDAAMVRDRQFVNKVRNALDGRPLDLIMECIGGEILKKGLILLAPEGRMVVYGSAQFASTGNRPNYLKLAWKYLKRPKVDPLMLPNRNISLLGFNLIWLYEKVEKMHAILKEIDRHDIGKPYIGHRFTFNELPKGLKLFQSGKTKGKVVVAINHR